MLPAQFDNLSNASGPAGPWYGVATGLILAMAVLLGPSAATAAPREGAIDKLLPLPHYDLEVRLDVEQHTAQVRQRVTWTNRHQRPAAELVFNVYSHFKVPDAEVGYLAKTLEILRLMPSECMDFDGNAGAVNTITLLPARGVEGASSHADGEKLTFHYRQDNQTALVVPLPRPVESGQSITLDIDFAIHLPQKQGRWGQWKGVTFLVNWLPVLAYYDETGWQPTPFIPWHQPFFNEAGIYTARITAPSDQKLAHTGSVTRVEDLGDGLQRVSIGPCPARDFALLCSSRYREHVGHATTGAKGKPVKVRVMAFPEHEFYAKEMVRIACEAIAVYSRWFGPYPYPEFTIAESYFGWNGNECGALVMIDERVFAMPHLALPFVEYLVSHETCHQWWYNVVGTNGYCETWMDEGLATYFTHRMLNEKCGDKNNAMLQFPSGLKWLPNIHRQNYRFSGMYGTIQRSECSPTVQELPRYGHIVNLFSMCYDKGSKIVGMIEERLGEAAFLDFMRRIYRRYSFRILRVKDFQRELEEYTGQSWDEFFRNWLHGSGLSDWSIEDVRIEAVEDGPSRKNARKPWRRLFGPRTSVLDRVCRVTVILHQKAEINEPTVLGFQLEDGDGYAIRVPVVPQAEPLELHNPSALIEPMADNRIRVEVVLPRQPAQIAVDPDQVLVDKEPTNNYWRTRVRWRLTPLYTLLDETDLTSDYDRWNVNAGPWLFTAAYNDPWFVRSAMAGLRVGSNRTQQFVGGAYLGYRADYRDLAAGVDAVWDHCPWPKTQLGITAERSLSKWGDGSDNNRAVFFGRYVFAYGSSLYLPPMQYVEMFGSVTSNNLPEPRTLVTGAQRFDQQTTVGLHYHINYLTPYWDAEGGYQFDATYAEGLPILGEHEPFHQLSAQLSWVKCLPEWLGPLSETRLAARLYGGVGLPNKGEYFTLGGSQLFRGFDLSERQGSLVWIGSLEWRVPLARQLTWDACDHAVGVRNIYAAAFYDVGDAYIRNRSAGEGVAHALGVGLRVDAALFSIVERTVLRLDVAKAINVNTPWQLWFGVQHPF